MQPEGDKKKKKESRGLRFAIIEALARRFSRDTALAAGGLFEHGQTNWIRDTIKM
jgi:hypothetical protein